MDIYRWLRLFEERPRRDASARFLPLYGRKVASQRLPFPFPFPFIPWGFSLCWFFTVSSMDKMTHAASVALAMAFSLTMIGSQTKLSYALKIPILMQSTPKQRPSRPPVWCFWRSLFRISVASPPLCGKGARDAFQRPREVVNDNLLLAIGGA